MLPLLGQIRFDPTVSFGSLIWALSTLVLAVFAWRDLSWRVKNVEIWKVEVVADNKKRDADDEKRDAAIQSLQRILYHITGGEEGRGTWIRRDETRTDYNGPERRKRP